MRASLAKIKALIIDMDGVLYRGKTALSGSAELFRFLSDNDIKFKVVTNNATVNQAMVAEKLSAMGITLSPDAIMTSGTAAATFLAAHAPAGSSVFVVGEPPLEQEMVRYGLRLAGRDADYVVAGLDRTINFQKLMTATIAIRHGARFIGTNPDKTLPMENEIIPGAGSIIAAIATATDQKPLIIGKPEPAIFEQALDELGVMPSEAASLGDRLETDILGGNRLGMTTILVLTGVSTAAEIHQTDIRPDYIYADIPALLEDWQQALSS